MKLARQLAARAIMSSCSVGVQEALRRRYIRRKVLREKTPKEPAMAALPSLIGRGARVADIGANVGIYTKALSSLVGASGRVFAFEPLQNNFDILSDLVERAKLMNVSVFHAAVGDTVGARDIVIPQLGGFAGYYWAHFATPGSRGRRERVDVLSLDQLADEGHLPALDFIKCDVEGAELEVLQGGRSLIEASRPSLLLEIEREHSDAVFDFLLSRGYGAFVFDGVLQPTATYQDGRFANYFFLPKSIPAPRR
jgi:FkbM family methyltransferase